MNHQLQKLLDTLLQSENITAAEKSILKKGLKEASSELEKYALQLAKAENTRADTEYQVKKMRSELAKDKVQLATLQREMETEASLERIRNRTLLMKDSNELAVVASFFFDEFSKLHLLPEKARTYFTHIDEERKTAIAWMTRADGTVRPGSHEVPMTTHKPLQLMFEAWREQKPIFIRDISGAVLADYLQFLSTLPHVKNDEQLQKLITSPPDRIVFNDAMTTYGTVGIIAFEPLSKEAQATLIRFAKVFEFTYTRFLDLKKAESQAREAQIELGLERVRARAMSMQNSQELNELIGTVFSELTKLDLSLTRCLIIIYDKKTKDARWWMANSETPETPMNFLLKYHDHPPFLAYIDAWQSHAVKWAYELKGEVKRDWDDFIFAETELSLLPDFVKAGMRAPDRVWLSGSFNNFGCLTVASLEQLSEEHFDILIRFAKVFELTYTRFNDLKQAEAQAMEAKIEASLERVRAKAMAMHSSEDLAATISAFYHELETFSFTPRRCGVGLLHEGTRIAELSTMNTTTEGKSIEVIGTLKMEGHRVLEGVYENWLIKKEYHPVLRGQELKEYYQLLKPKIAFPDYPDDVVQYGYFFYFPEGGVYAWTDKEMKEDELKIYRRFTSVLSLTYRRYKDLKEAEAQTREAQIEAALERVRAKTMAMHKSEQLAETASVLFEQFDLLGKIPDRISIGIFKEDLRVIELWVTDQSGSQLNHAFSASIEEPTSVSKVYAAWKQKKESVVIDLTGHELREWLRFLRDDVKMSVDEKSIKGRRVHQGAFFSQGMLMFTTHEPIADDLMSLLVRFARVFDQTYTRFLDLKKAEALAVKAAEDLVLLKAEKKRTEETLVELKATQAQLIHSEKMASLGELTAGIAHEIQNPLNFVNNFSEVSNELVDEMLVELEQENKDEARAIASSVKQNLEKILHHGKRAGDIVKGMLQHSRSSSSTKEPTDINKLADEYLRLAYHGLRAKEKSFNAKMKTDFDESINPVNVIPQDIGRVMLNLITNAFYAVAEKMKQNPVDYEPTVVISTRNNGSKILVEIKDNGPGIPQTVLDKIFQPFFTTKPTGQGTGLGLSLSYDIMKAHGGELIVQTKENEGATFIIQLPIT